MDKKRILICDDEEGIRESLNLILKDEYDLNFCINGQACLDCLVGDKNYDLLLLDIKMPKVNGLEILKQIKTKQPNLKVIVVTGYKSVETATEAINAGAADYIVKPFESKELLASIRKNI